MSLFRSSVLVIFIISAIIVGVMMDEENVEEIENEPTETGQEPLCDGTICGCFKNKCWVNVEESARNENDWWCYARKLEEQAGRRKRPQSCKADRECSFDRQCVDCVQYKGNEDDRRVQC